MNEDIRKYAKIGLVHHMLFPECVNDPDYHIETLLEFIKRKDIETFDCFMPFGTERRNRAIDRIRESGKEVVYSLHCFPLKKISLASFDPQEQQLTKFIIEDQINIAALIGATAFVFASGADFPDNRVEAKKNLKNFCSWFCMKLKLHKIDALLEPFDRIIDKKFLLGSVDECVNFLDSLPNKINNIGIELDFAHLPLMGEGFEFSIARTSQYLKRVHLGNCILKNKDDPLYGDEHPPIGIEGGEIDIAELSVILKNLLKIGYLNKNNRGSLVLEIKPFPGKSIEYTVNDNFERLKKAWKLVEIDSIS